MQTIEPIYDTQHIYIIEISEKQVNVCVIYIHIYIKHVYTLCVYTHMLYYVDCI